MVEWLISLSPFLIFSFSHLLLFSLSPLILPAPDQGSDLGFSKTDIVEQRTVGRAGEAA